MAQKNQTVETPKFKTYKNDGKGFSELNAGEEITGVFLGVTEMEIKDKRTKELKSIRVYRLMTDQGLVKIGARALLDSTFDDIVEEHGGFRKEGKYYQGPGIDYLKNRLVRFVRGADTKTSEKNPMGTYEIQVEED